jgi:hypothetical protein
MTAQLPPMIPGIEYAPAEHQRSTRGSSWRWHVLRPVEYILPWSPPMDARFLDRDGIERFRIQRGVLSIAAGYAWNGCSPKRQLRGRIWIGTPDFARTIAASLPHDAFYQASACRHASTRREVVDDYFEALLRAARFPLAGLYAGAVRDFGEPYWAVESGMRSARL